MDDEQIIALYFARSEQAITETDRKYGQTCRSLSRKILSDGRDVEECINDAYLGLWNAIPPAHPNPLAAYLCRIVRNLSIARYHSNTAKKRHGGYGAVLEELEQVLASPQSVEDEVEGKELARLIETFLDSLTKENRVIFLRRYWFCDSYVEIAERVGLSGKNVSVRLVRMRKQLQRYLAEQGVIV